MNASIALMNVQNFIMHDRCPPAFSELKRSLNSNRGRDQARLARLADVQPKSIGILLTAFSKWRYTTFSEMPQRYFFPLLLAASAILIRPFDSSYVLFAALCAAEMLLSLTSIGFLRERRPVPSARSAKIFNPTLLAMPEVAFALAQTVFPGRGDEVWDDQVPGLRWLLDCAHTPVRHCVFYLNIS